jgi:hypothetical protein
VAGAGGAGADLELAGAGGDGVGGEEVLAGEAAAVEDHLGAHELQDGLAALAEEGGVELGEAPPHGVLRPAPVPDGERAAGGAEGEEARDPEAAAPQRILRKVSPGASMDQIQVM